MTTSRKKIISIVIFSLHILFIFGCSSKIKDENIPDDKKVTIACSNNCTKEDVNQIVKQINNKEIKHHIGMSRIKDIYDKKNSKTQEKRTIIDLIMKINKGNKVENFGYLLGVTGFKKDVKENIHNISGLLRAMSRNKYITIEEDSLLIYFIDLLISRYNSRNTYSLEIAAIEKYYKYSISKYKKKLESTEIFVKLSSLSKIIYNDSKLYNIFRPIFKNINIQTMNFSTHMAFGRLTHHLITKINKFNFTPTVINSFLKNAHWSILRLNKDLKSGKAPSFNLDELYNSMDDLSASFDRNISYYKDINKKEWILLLDKRYDLFIEFQKTISLLEKMRKIDHTSITPNHPVVKIYFRRGLLVSENYNLIDKKFSPKSKSDFLLLVKEFYKTINANFLNDSNLPKNKNNKEYSKKEYLLDLYDLEFSRNIMEIMTIFNGHNESEVLHFKRIIYKNTFSKLVNALNYREGLMYSSHELFVNPTSNLGDLSDTAQIRDLGEKSELILCTNKSCKDEFSLRPGIYISNKHLDIYAEGANIIFHPLSILLAPGKNITLYGKKLISPWIDTSAPTPRLNLLGKKVNGKHGGSIKLITSKGIGNLPLLASIGSQSAFGGKSGNGGNISLFYKTIFQKKHHFNMILNSGIPYKPDHNGADNICGMDECLNISGTHGEIKQ